MKYLLILFLILGCQENGKEHKRVDIKDYNENRYYIESSGTTIYEVCINNIIYYSGYSGLDGGPILTPKIKINSINSAKNYEECEE